MKESLYDVLRDDTGTVDFTRLTGMSAKAQQTVWKSGWGQTLPLLFAVHLPHKRGGVGVCTEAGGCCTLDLVHHGYSGCVH